MPETDKPSGLKTEISRNRRRKLAILIVLLAVVALIIWLLSRGCQSDAQAETFNYFRDKAQQLDNQPENIIKFVRDDVHTLSYRGNVKGPLGTLWNGGGSPEEKLALAQALMNFATTSRNVQLADVAPDITESAQQADKQYSVQISHRLLKADGKHLTTAVYEGPIAHLVGNVHSLWHKPDGTTAFAIRTRDHLGSEAATTEGIGEEVLFTLQQPGSDKPLVVTRELWHRDNRTGPTAPMPGARHDFVVLPCRINAYVREKEELLLNQKHRVHADESRPYLALLDYARRCDKQLEIIEKSENVRAQFELPRILILSTYDLPADAGGPAYALDLRLNRPSFLGDADSAFRATQMRSFIESGMEQKFLAEWSGQPATSTYDVFCNLSDDRPTTPARRLDVISRSLEILRASCGTDGHVTFSASSGRKSPEQLVALASAASPGQTNSVPSVTATRLADGKIRLVGSSPLIPELVQRMAKEDVHLPVDTNGRLDGTFDGLGDAAIAVESALLFANTPKPVSPAYLLATDIATGSESLVVPEAIFQFQWGDPGQPSTQRIRIKECQDDLEFRWRVHTGTMPVAGERTIAASALADSSVHNPWYRRSTGQQSDATSFCVSRAVFARLKSGQQSAFALQGPYGEKDDEFGPRPIEWQGHLRPTGTGSHTVNINGRPLPVKVLKCSLGSDQLALLDDAVFPIGMADALVSVSTAVRGRIVDEEGQGVGDVNVSIRYNGENTAEASTWPDGSFRLPPAPGGSYGPVRITVSRGESLLADNLQADLSAPGLDVLTLTVRRKPVDLVWINPQEADKLKSLPISDQVRRHARRDLAEGLTVIIPDRMIDVGYGLETTGYYAFDRHSGNIVGVTEDGLHGSNSVTAERWRKALANAAADLNKAKGSKPGPLLWAHMYRGALVASWVYCAYRVGGDEHDEAILAMLEEMDDWEKATNMMTGIEVYAGAKARGKAGGAMGQGATGGLDDDWAKVAFKAGYLSTTAMLAHQLEGS